MDNLGVKQMNIKSIVIGFAAVLFILQATPASAQECGPRDIFKNKLADTYSEHPIAMGLTNKGTVLEVFTSEKGSWTFLITMPNGMSCVVATGSAWEMLKIKALGEIS